MTQRTRYFLVSSGLIVLVGLGTGLVAVYNGNFGSRRLARLGELEYVSPDATAVAYADVRQIMDSEFRQRLRALLPANEGKDKFLADTGIDIERDIDSVTAGLSPNFTSEGGPVILLRGRFNEQQIEEVALKHGATVQDYKGRRLLQAPEPAVVEGRDGHSAEWRESGLAFLAPGLVALGQLEGIRRSIDAADSDQSVLTNDELMKFVNGVSGSSDAWIAGRLDAVSGHPGWSETMKDRLGEVQWFSLGAGVDRTVNCRLVAQARDAQSGEQLRAIVNGALAMARIMADKDTRLTGVLNTVQSKGTGSQVELSFTVSPDVLDLMTGPNGKFTPSLSN
jgi:hypothetical protein